MASILSRDPGVGSRATDSGARIGAPLATTSPMEAPLQPLAAAVKLLSTAFVLTLFALGSAFADDRPNILWITIEDWS